MSGVTTQAAAAVGNTGLGAVGITGLGAVSSVGQDPEQCFESLLAGRSGLAPLRSFDPAQYGVTSAYEVDDRPRGSDRPGRAGELLVRAVRQATDQAGLHDLRDVPVLVGTGLRELRTAELAWAAGEAVDPDRMHFGGILGDELGARDVHTFSNACSASLYALGLGSDLVAAGEPAVVVAGVDVLTASMFGLLDRVHVHPPDRVRPFDDARRGVVLGEGAAAVVLSAAPPSGTDPAPGCAPALARLCAVALGCDAFHVTAPDPLGIERTVRAGHDAAGVSAADVGVVYAHGTGTVLNDQAEAEALTAVFGATSPGPEVAAVKGATGHTSGGSGLFSLVMAVLGLHRGLVPGINGLTEVAPAARGLRVGPGARQVPDHRVAQVNAFGFGGLNAVAVLRREA